MRGIPSNNMSCVKWLGIMFTFSLGFWAKITFIYNWEECKPYIGRRLLNLGIIQEEQFREMDFIFEYE